MKLAVLVSHPIQYFAPVYRALNTRTDLNLMVFYHCRAGIDSWFDPGFEADVRWDVPLVDGYPHSFLSTRNKLGGLRVRIIGALFRFRPDAIVVHGYSSPTNLLGMFVAKLIGARILMRGDTRLLKDSGSSPIRAHIKRSLFRFIDGFITIGSANRNYYAAHGVPAEKLFFAPLAIDTSLFAADASQRSRYRSALRAKLGIEPQAILICFASKLIRRKRAEDLLRAFQHVKAVHSAAHLILVGSGEEESALRGTTLQCGISGVHFLGFQNQTELPHILAASDIFVLPSQSEPWGLAVNEALAAGIPVIASDEVGAAFDMIENSGAGVVYPCGDVTSLANSLVRLVTTPELRESMGRLAVAISDRWNVQASSDGIAHAVAAVASPGK